MTVENVSTLDWLGIERGSGHIVLTVIDDLDWTDDAKHVAALQAKLNTYLAFVEGEEIWVRVREELGREMSRETPIRISVLAKFPLPKEGELFVEHAQKVFRGAGFELSFELVKA